MVFDFILRRHIKYAISVDEKKGFLAAADECGVSQPALSKLIGDLEDALRIKLFERTHWGIRTTPEGKEFLEDARKWALHAQAAVQRAQSASLDRTFVLGYSPHLNSHLVHAARSAHEKFARSSSGKLEMRSAPSHDLVVAVRNGEIDAGLVLLPIQELAGVKSIPIHIERIVVALPPAHHLARQRGPLSPDQLRNIPMIVISRQHSRHLHDFLREVCVQRGFEPICGGEALHMAHAIDLVLSGAGFAFAWGDARRLGYRRVRFRPLAGEPVCIQSAIVYHSHNQAPFLRVLIGEFRKAQHAVRHAEPTAGDVLKMSA